MDLRDSLDEATRVEQSYNALKAEQCLDSILGLPQPSKQVVRNKMKVILETRIAWIAKSASTKLAV